MKKYVLLLPVAIFALQTATAQNFKYGKVSKEELAEKQHPQDPTASAAILYREVKTTFEYSEDAGFYMVTDFLERIKIYDKEGFSWATKEVDLYQGQNSGDDELIGLRGVTYFLGADGKIEETKLKKDGIFEVETSKYYNQTKFTMPALREGCVVEYKYSIKSPFISNIDEFKFQETIPVNKVHVRFASPEYLVFQTHQRGWLPFKVEKESRDRSMSFNLTSEETGIGGSAPRTEIRNISFREDIYAINLENVPAMKEEANAGNINNYATALKFELSYVDFPGSSMKTFTTTWEAVAKNIYNADSFGGELARKNYFEGDLSVFLKDLNSPEEKMLVVFEFVKNKMNWNSYNGYTTNEGVKEAYKKGSGNVADINLMLVAMLRHAGLSANPVLVSTKANGIPLFPTHSGFNYVIAAVEIGSSVIVMDATNKNAEIGILSPKILNWQGRIVREDHSSGWVPLSPRTPATHDAMLTIDLSDDLSFSGISKNRYSGHYALACRENFRTLGAADVQKRLEDEFGAVDLSEIEFKNLQKTHQPVSLQYAFEAADAMENIGGKLYFSPLAFMALKENPYKLEARNYPIDYGFPVKDRFLITINVPEGYQVETLPENIYLNLGDNLGSFKYLISQKQSQLQLSVEFAINASLIGAEEYGNLKKFYEMLINKEKEKIVFIKA